MVPNNRNLKVASRKNGAWWGLLLIHKQKESSTGLLSKETAGPQEEILLWTGKPARIQSTLSHTYFSFPICFIPCISVTQVTEWQMAFHSLLMVTRDVRPLSSASSVSHLSAPNYFLPFLILIPFFLDWNSDLPNFAPNINRQWQGCNVSSSLRLQGSRHLKRCWPLLLCINFFIVLNQRQIQIYQIINFFALLFRERSI